MDQDVAVENIDGPRIDGTSSTNTTCSNTCDGSATVSASGSQPLEYFWPATEATSPSTSGLCAGTYMVRVTDSNNCTTVAHLSVNSPPAIEDSAVVTASTCGDCNGSVTLFVSGGDPGYTFDWSNGDTSQTADSLCSGVHGVVITDNSGCTDTSFHNVNGDKAPQISTPVTDVSCQDSCDGSATASATGGIPPHSFIWLDQAGNDTLNTGPSISGLCPGDYVVRVEDDTGCVSFENISITEPDPIQFNPAITQNTSCYGSCDGEGTISFNGGTLPFDIQWETGDTTAKATGLCAGTYRAVVTDDNGCLDTSTVTVDEPDSITVSLDTAINSSCPDVADGSIQITTQGGTPPYDHTWTGPNGFSSTSEDISGLLPGTYFVTITDTNGCSLQDSVSLTPEIVLNMDAGKDTTYCEGFGPITLNGSGANSYKWVDANGDTVGSGSSVIVEPPTGTNPFILVGQRGPCTATDTVEVIVNGKPDADAGPDKEIVENGKVEIGGDPTGPPGSDYTWTPDTAISDPKASNPKVSPAQTTTYIVQVVSPSGCIGKDTVTVENVPTVEPVEGFSPNGDGVNETWTINHIQKFPDAVVEVYNRWGERVFRSEGYDDPWDGTFEGEPLPVGTYYYVIDLNDPEVKNLTGPVTILR